MGGPQKRWEFHIHWDLLFLQPVLRLSKEGQRLSLKLSITVGSCGTKYIRSIFQCTALSCYSSGSGRVSGVLPSPNS